ncbi:MAG TPA: orotidine 5'-phosphate decarboxylase / HUMPS family protein [Planctomycetota bacterium]|nr:orotidine 5'-phosphate decarboxylase / HUMPS family protein [Planctomycetota bacterium]
MSGAPKPTSVAAEAGTRLQVALDFLELSRAIKCAREAVAGGAELLEVGTPLLKSEGLDAVRKLRAEFPTAKHPTLRIVCDTKTMDAGRVEFEGAAKAGAAIATVLAGAADSTIRDCVEAGRNYGIQVEADLINVADPVERARQCDALGVDIVGVHVGIDEQMRGRDPFDLLRKVRTVVACEIAVAGGITSETAAAAAEAGADIVIVGGAITKAEDAAGASKAVVAALRSRRAVESRYFRRVTDDRVADVLKLVSTPNLSDAMHRSGEMSGLEPLQQGVKVFGPAVTVRTYPGDWAKPVEAIDHCKPGDVLVIDAGGRAPAVWGELASESAKVRGLAAVVIDGAIRDVDAIRSIGFPAWARIRTPTAWEPKGFGEIGQPVVCGGQRVAPRDWIVADDSGLVRIPREKLAEIVNRASDVFEHENRLRAEIRAGGTLSALKELARWEKK